MGEFFDGMCFGVGLGGLLGLCGYLSLKDKIKGLERLAFNEGVQIALDNAAMKAHDMGHPEIREEINHLYERAR